MLRKGVTGMQNNIMQKDKKKSAESRFSWLAFALAYSWYNIFFYNGMHSVISPLVPVMKALNVNADIYLGITYIPLIVTVVLSFFFLGDGALVKYRTFWYIVHATLFVTVIMLPFLHSLSVFYVLVAIAGIACGLIIYRIFYSLFFFPPKLGWIKIFLILLACLRFGVALFKLFPPALYFAPMYCVSVVIMGIALFFSVRFKGNILESRRNLPESKPKLSTLIPYLIFMGVVQFYISGMKVLIVMVSESNHLNLFLYVMSSVVSMSIIWILGDRIKKKETFLRFFFVLMMLTFASYQIFGISGEILTAQLMEPAFLTWNMFFYSMLVSLYYNYGKRHAQLRMVLMFVFIALIFGQTLISYLFRYIVPLDQAYFSIIYVSAFGLYLLIPRVTKIANLTEIVEGGLSPHISRSDEILGTENHNASLQPTVEIPFSVQGREKLTDREHEILSYIIEGQDSDVIAYILSISQNTVRSHTKNICGKFGVNSKSELINVIKDHFDLSKSEEEESKTWSENRNLGLTQREKDVLRHLLIGESYEQIADELYLSSATIRTHTHNIYKKCGVSTRKELIEFMNDDVLI